MPLVLSCYRGATEVPERSSEFPKAKQLERAGARPGLSFLDSSLKLLPELSRRHKAISSVGHLTALSPTGPTCVSFLLLGDAVCQLVELDMGGTVTHSVAKYATSVNAESSCHPDGPLLFH